MNSAASSVLVQRPSLTEIKIPFEGDLLERAALAQRLTSYLQRLNVGAVVAIDAPWGEGKTWFGRHWAKKLEDDGHRLAFIDAFGQDYAEDAFMVLSAAVLKLCAGDATTTEKVKRGAGEVMRAVLPVATKAVIHLAATAVGAGGVVGAINQVADLSLEADEFASVAKQAGDQAGDVTSAWVKRRLEQWEAEQKSVAGFRQILGDFALERFKTTRKPVVIVVDELDRCRPAFAVALLERIKHFFDVPHLVFVLLMNRDQLEKAIRGVYGAETDAAAYLGKFLHLSLRLPKSQAGEELDEQPTYLFVKNVLVDLGMHSLLFLESFATTAVLFDLSLREIERGCTLFALSDGRQESLRGYVTALKLKRPDLYRDFLDPTRAKGAHAEMLSILTAKGIALLEATGNSPGPAANLHDIHHPGPFLDGLLQFHGMYTRRSDYRTVEDSTGKRSLSNMERIFGGGSAEKSFERALRSIDLNLQ